MASQAVIISLRFLTLLIFLMLAAGINGGKIGVYWGQHGDNDERTLAQTCVTNKYDIVTIAYLYQFGHGSTPEINLAGHSHDISSDIKSCQANDVKVILAIGGSGGFYYLNSSDDASTVATYLWNNYLGGEPDHFPLPLGGEVDLDGISFDIEAISKDHYDELAGNLTALFNDYCNKKTYYLAAAPNCPYPDYWLGDALKTGLFHYVWVRFYDNSPCQYNSDTGDISKLVTSWDEWNSKLNATKIFLGLPASPDYAPSGGYIPPADLISKVIPAVRNSTKYGGVMLWTKYYDEKTGYSSAILGHV